MAPAVQATIPYRRIALAHDYFVQDGGAERVFARFQLLFPHATIFTILHDPRRFSFSEKTLRSTFLNRIPFATRSYQWLMPLMPMAVEELDFSGFDLILSSSSSFMKGILTPPGSTHICYLHTPTRFLWHERLRYVDELRAPWPAKILLPPLLHRLRTWDVLAANRPDHLLTNSQTSRARIKRYYRREAQVLFPPVDIDQIPLSHAPGSFWLAGGRLVAYKRFDLIVRTFAKLDLPLKLFGEGPELAQLKKNAGPKTEFLGRISDVQRNELFQHCHGFLHPQEEDFGITAVEVMATGKPVIAYNVGGGAETVIADQTGIHFSKQTWPHLGEALIRFRPESFNPQTIRAHASQFSATRFDNALIQLLTQHDHLV